MGSQKLLGAIRAAKAQGRVPLIAETKCRTPRDGDLLAGRDPQFLAAQMARAGAIGLSVVTEPAHFGGSLEILQKIAKGCSLPILRKDFIRSASQIRASKDAGADAVLLIASMLPSEVLLQLNKLAQVLGLETVVEVHTPQEMEKVCGLSPDIIGINNRDILKLETDSGDMSITESIAPMIPPAVLLISESAISTRDDVQRAIKAGADAVLVGTTLMKASNLTQKIQSLLNI